jgi:hypothetical protein
LERSPVLPQARRRRVAARTQRKKAYADAQPPSHTIIPTRTPSRVSLLATVSSFHLRGNDFGYAGLKRHVTIVGVIKGSTHQRLLALVGLAMLLAFLAGFSHHF